MQILINISSVQQYTFILNLFMHYKTSHSFEQFTYIKHNTEWVWLQISEWIWHPYFPSLTVFPQYNFIP